MTGLRHYGTVTQPTSPTCFLNVGKVNKKKQITNMKKGIIDKAKGECPN